MADSDDDQEDLTMYDEEARFDAYGNVITAMPTMEVASQQHHRHHLCYHHCHHYHYHHCHRHHHHY